MLYREIMAVCSQIHTKHINTLCGQNVELLNVKLAVYIYIYGESFFLKWLAAAYNTVQSVEPPPPFPILHLQYPIQTKPHYMLHGVSQNTDSDSTSQKISGFMKINVYNHVHKRQSFQSAFFQKYRTYSKHFRNLLVDICLSPTTGISHQKSPPP